MNQQNTEQTRAPGDARQRRVLVADDDPDMGALLKRALQNANMSVRLVNSGQAALEIFQADSKTAECEFFLTDRNLPDISGEDLFRFFRGGPGRGAIPAALMSADLDSAARERFFAMGFTEVFHKPFDPAKIAERIDAILDLVSSLDPSDANGEWSRGGTIDADQVVDAELQAEYLSGLAERIRVIAEAGAAIAENRLDALSKLRTEAHKIAGTAAMFGVPEFEAPASKIESIAEKLADENRGPNEIEQDDLAASIQILRDLLK